MLYRVRVFSHPYYDGIVHTIAVHRKVTAGRLGEVIATALDGQGVKVVVEDEVSWAEAERETFNE